MECGWGGGGLGDPATKGQSRLPSGSTAATRRGHGDYADGDCVGSAMGNARVSQVKWWSSGAEGVDNGGGIWRGWGGKASSVQCCT